MSAVSFGTPSWDARKSVYTIQINTPTVICSDAQYIDLSGSSQVIESPDTGSEVFQVFLKSFVKSLVEMDAQHKWFSSRLKEVSLLKRLSHKWLPCDVLSTFDWAEGQWKPFSLEISTQGFILCWSLIGFTKASPKINSRFLPPISRPESPTYEEPVGNLRQFTIQTSGDHDELEQVTDIPFTNENTAVDFQQQMRDKGALQEARLRLALAKLKAERLSNTYYQKYGEDLPDEESDLEDSDSSEE